MSEIFTAGTCTGLCTKFHWKPMGFCHLRNGHSRTFSNSSRTEKFIIIAIDHFTKWIEVEAVSIITEAKIRSFFYKEIIYRFGIPHTLITNNRKQFDNFKFKQFCYKLKIKVRFTSVAHPQTNTQTEVTN